MKKYMNPIVGCLFASYLVMSFSSCRDYLDVDKYFNDLLTVDSAFSKRVYVEGWLSNAYGHMYEEVCDIASGGNGGYALFSTDDLIRGDDGDKCKQFQNGEYSADNQLDQNKWARVYEPIRKATTLIYNVDKCTEMKLAERADLKGQARFLRAYSYWVLIRQYGPIPLIPEEGFDISMSYDELSVPRSTFDECVEYIVAEFTLAAQGLPNSRTANNIGRPTRGAALAARAKVLLYAASPMYNGNKELFNVKNQDGTQLIPQTYDEAKWARAAAAALEVIRLDQYKLLTVPKTEKTVIPPLHAEYSAKAFPDGWEDIDPFESYRQIFNGNISAFKNPELIFTRPNDPHNNINDIVRISMPATLNGQNSLGVTQKQVDAYAMRDGRTITQAAVTGDYLTTGFTKSNSATDEGGYDFLPINVSLRYANREPRFYASIAYNGSVWECTSASEIKYQNKQVFYYKGEDDGKQLNQLDKYNRTGVSMKKYYNPEDSRTANGYMVDKFEPAIRYADVLLWYAEALNELTSGKVYTFKGYNDEDITVSRSVSEIQASMKPIRMRAGLPDLTADTYTNPDQFRMALKHERQIELFAESARFYDLRRWKDADVEENMPIKGCNMEMKDDDLQREDFYKQVNITSIPKVFLPKMYLWPIMTEELKRNKRLTQNPEW